MTSLVLTAAKGAPGVSTWATALTLSWPAATGRSVLLVDADVSGGGPLSAYQRHGLGDGRGLLAWAAAGGRSRPLEDELLALGDRGRAWLLPGLADGAGARALGARWPQLAHAVTELCSGHDLDVLVDMGRFGSRDEPDPLLASADLVLVVLRSTFDSLSFTQPLPEQLRVVTAAPVAAVLVGDRSPYSAREVSRALGVDVVGVMPFDPTAAHRFLRDPVTASGGRSALVRAATGAAPGVREMAGQVSRA